MQLPLRGAPGVRRVERLRPPPGVVGRLLEQRRVDRPRVAQAPHSGPNAVAGLASHLMRRLPEFRLVAEPLTADAKAAAGFEWAAPEVGTRHKLGGEPDLVQAGEYPRCPECGQSMSFYGQLDSIGDDVALADAGVLLAFVCFDCFTAAAQIESS
jgi:hypothetical protein